MSKFYRGPSIDASYQVSYHLAMRFQRKSCFRNWPIRNKNCLWRPCLLTDQNGMSISHRGPSIDASYHVSVHLAKLFQSRRFLEIDQLETRIACGGQMNRNLVESIYGRFSITIAHFVRIHLQTWPPQAILVSDWLISKNLLLWNRVAKWTEIW